MSSWRCSGRARGRSARRRRTSSRGIAPDVAVWRPIFFGAEHRRKARDMVKAIGTNRIGTEGGLAHLELCGLDSQYAVYRSEHIGVWGKCGVCFECGGAGHFGREFVLRGAKGGSGTGGQGKGLTSWGARKGKTSSFEGKGRAEGSFSRLRAPAQGPEQRPAQGAGVQVQRPVPQMRRMGLQTLRTSARATSRHTP